MKQSKKIAITGGIGSGKSTVAGIIAEYGYAVFSCDEIYSELLQEKNFVDILCRHFGEVRNADGSLNKCKLSEIVFQDKTKLNLLDDLAHPEIFKRMFERSDKMHADCFFEVPVLFEKGYEKYFDNIIVVMRDKKERINSVMRRDGLTEAQIINRIDNQYDYSSFDFEEYYVIYNNGDIDHLTAKIINFLEEYL